MQGVENKIKEPSVVKLLILLGPSECRQVVKANGFGAVDRQRSRQWRWTYFMDLYCIIVGFLVLVYGNIYCIIVVYTVVSHITLCYIGSLYIDIRYHIILYHITPSPPTKSLDFTGFDSSRLLILRGGNSDVRIISKEVSRKVRLEDS